MKTPDVVVVVMSGMGENDHISINYGSVVSQDQAQADLNTLQELAKWEIQDPEMKTETSSVPEAKANTSISFQAPRVVYSTQGLLLIEPFIVALKRYNLVEINYIIMGKFDFKGLGDFENDFVRIDLNSRDNTYRYRIAVKEHDFQRLNLPLKHVEQNDGPNASISGLSRWAIVTGLALAGAVLAYVVTAVLAQRRRR